jgi:hypothetical protein
MQVLCLTVWCALMLSKTWSWRLPVFVFTAILPLSCAFVLDPAFINFPSGCASQNTGYHCGSLRWFTPFTNLYSPTQVACSAWCQGWFDAISEERYSPHDSCWSFYHVWWLCILVSHGVISQVVRSLVQSCRLPLSLSPYHLIHLHH